MKSNKKYFLKYAKFSGKDKTAEDNKIIPREWKYGVLLRLFDLILF
jgi:hypothetical protein